MSLGEKLERRAERPPLAFPDATADRAVDPSGYAASDDVGRPVPGGALGAAGACGTMDGLGYENLNGIWLGEQHAVRPAPLEYQADPIGPANGDRTRAPSDSEVYEDLSGTG